MWNVVFFGKRRRCGSNGAAGEGGEDDICAKDACPLRNAVHTVSARVFSLLRLDTLAGAACVIACGVSGLLLSLLFGWDDSNSVLFLFVSITILGVVLYIYDMKHESRY